MCTSLVKPVFWAFRHELFSSLDVGVLIVKCGAGVFGPLDEFICCGALFWKNRCF